MCVDRCYMRLCPASRLTHADVDFDLGEISSYTLPSVNSTGALVTRAAAHRGSAAAAAAAAQPWPQPVSQHPHSQPLTAMPSEQSVAWPSSEPSALYAAPHGHMAPWPAMHVAPAPSEPSASLTTSFLSSAEPPPLGGSSFLTPAGDSDTAAASLEAVRTASLARLANWMPPAPAYPSAQGAGGAAARLAARPFTAPGGTNGAATSSGWFEPSRRAGAASSVSTLGSLTVDGGGSSWHSAASAPRPSTSESLHSHSRLTETVSFADELVLASLAGQELHPAAGRRPAARDSVQENDVLALIAELNG